MGRERLSTRWDVSFLCLSVFPGGTASARAAHIFYTPETVTTWKQHPIAVELQIVCGAFLYLQGKEAN